MLWAGAMILIVVGVAGTVLPVIPAAPLMLAGMLLGAWIDDFQRIGAPSLIILTILAVAMTAIDFIAGALGAKKLGASRMAVIGATIGSILGIFAGIVGLILGPFVGAFVGEMIAQGDAYRAGKVGLATWLGMVIGTVAKVALAFVMVGIYGFAYWF